MRRPPSQNRRQKLSPLGATAWEVHLSREDSGLAAEALGWEEEELGSEGRCRSDLIQVNCHRGSDLACVLEWARSRTDSSRMTFEDGGSGSEPTSRFSMVCEQQECSLSSVI